MGKFNPPTKQAGGTGKRTSVNVSMPADMRQAVKLRAEEHGYTGRNGTAEFLRLMIGHCLADLAKGKGGCKATDRQPVSYGVPGS